MLCTWYGDLRNAQSDRRGSSCMIPHNAAQNGLLPCGRGWDAMFLIWEELVLGLRSWAWPKLVTWKTFLPSLGTDPIGYLTALDLTAQMCPLHPFVKNLFFPASESLF